MIYQPSERRVIHVFIERHGFVSGIFALLWIWGLLYDIEYQVLQDYIYQDKQQEQENED